VRGTRGAEELRGAIEEDGEAENEKGSERNEKAVAVGRDAGPIGVAGDEKIKSEKGGKQRNAHTRLAAGEEEKSREGEKKNGSPGKKTVIGREEHAEKDGRGPEPVAERDISGFERASVNEIARDEGGKQTDEESCGEQNVAQEEFGDARNGRGRRTRLPRSFSGLRAKGELILAEGFDDGNGKDHGVGVVNVEHEAGDCGEYQPLGKRSRCARLMPIPKEKGDGESGMGVGPGRIEIHVDGKRAGPPDGESGKEGPALFDILARETERQEQAEKTIEGRGKGHGDAVGSGETVGGDGGGGTEGTRKKDAGMREEEKRRPKNRGTDGEMVVEVAGGGAKAGPGQVVFVETRAAEAGIGGLVVPGEIETVLDQRSAGKSVIADTIAAHPGIQKRKREKPEKEKQPLRFAGAARGRCAEVWLFRQRGACRKTLLSPAAINTAQHHDVEPISQDRGRDLVTANNRGRIVPHDVTWELDIRESKQGCSHARRCADQRRGFSCDSMKFVYSNPITLFRSIPCRS